MKSIQKKTKTIIASTCLLLTTILASCSSNGGGTVSTSGKEITINGSGASFPAPLYQKWIQEYTNQQKNLVINYESVGSGKGIQDFMAENVDFGATDAPLKAEEKQRYPQNRGSEAIQIPMTGGLLVFAYNLRNFESSGEIRLSRETYCNIVTGKIKTWNDPSIAKDNPDIRLPNVPLVFIHREDSSGTNFILTSHLQEACNDWQLGVNKQINWSAGLGADGTEGVSTAITQTEGAIGYIPYSYAQDNNLQTATLENKAGNFIKPSLESASEALSIDNVPDDFALVISDPQGAEAYPIVSLTWLLLYSDYEDKDKGKVVKDFVKWSLNNGDEIASELGYISIPNSLQQKVIAKIDQ